MPVPAAHPAWERLTSGRAGEVWGALWLCACCYVHGWEFVLPRTLQRLRLYSSTASASRMFFTGMSWSPGTFSSCLLLFLAGIMHLVKPSRRTSLSR